VGTASLDDPELLGNAPPPGEEAYTGFTFPGGIDALAPYSRPINKDLSEGTDNHASSFRTSIRVRTMVGFSAPLPGLTICPWWVTGLAPLIAELRFTHDKAAEKAFARLLLRVFSDSGSSPS